MSPESVADLKLFVEKAEALVASSFSDAMLRNESGVLFEWSEGKPYESVLIGAEGESVDAALLTLRMFVQNNERISLRRISKIFAKEPGLSQFIERFETVLGQINGALDSRNGIDFFGNNYTNREVFELLLYGTKAHANREKEAELKRVLKNTFIAQLFMNQANSVAAMLIRGAAVLAGISKMGLESNGV